MADNAWWGEFSFSLKQQRCWRLGERSIVLQRFENEWNSWNLESDIENDETMFFGELAENCCFEQAKFGRYLQQNTSEKVQVLPLLADRSVVARPDTPLTLLAGEKARLYVSTPVWFSAKLLPKGEKLLDLPFWRPSDSWFGPSTRVGQICYAKYTAARIQLANIDKRAHRAITPITVINNHSESLTIERINVPVTLLHLYADEENQLWTTGISVHRGSHVDNVELHLDKHAPIEAVSSVLVSSPRVASDKSILIRSISSLFA
ncbi:MAG: hypothetical protein V7736_14435 [Colwellia polaris]|jgi:hypothetical protein|uniref:hypothetical protein n=1 Tax=Colwellia polaris TaxID=326537 RepID=UPI000A1706F0|nr:hypothetical protein [Colwellia polaris]|tara:strand:- start:10163 stop:10951 length:789 start_codon:yes stop_codon:yes gene_type:complete